MVEWAGSHEFLFLLDAVAFNLIKVATSLIIPHLLKTSNNMSNAGYSTCLQGIL